MNMKNNKNDDNEKNQNTPQLYKEKNIMNKNKNNIKEEDLENPILNLTNLTNNSNNNITNSNISGIYNKKNVYQKEYPLFSSLQINTLVMEWAE